MTARELIRRMAVAEMFDRLSDDDKRLLLQSPGDSKEVRQQLDRIEKRVQSQGFLTDLLANVSGNAAYNVLVWAGKTLLKNIKL